MPHHIKGIVKPPFEMPPEKLERKSNNWREVKIPAAIRGFAWLCFIRSGIDFVFAFLVGIAPDTAIAKYVAVTFGNRFKYVPAEAEFFISAFLFAFIGWRWMSRDWRIRWAAMFLSGAIAARTLALIVADWASAAQGRLISNELEMELIVGVAFNLLICGYLAFYPGMAQAFKETPWE
jgi:hypothetical protein